MDRINHAAQSLQKNSSFIADIKKNTLAFFHQEPMETLYSSEERTIKAFRNEESMAIYIFDLKSERIEVSIQDIQDYNKKDTTQEIIYWHGRSKEVNDDLYYPPVVSFNLKEPIKQPTTEDEAIKQMFPKLDQNKPLNEGMITRFVENLKGLFGSNFYENNEFLRVMIDKKLGNGFDCSSDVINIKNYVLFLNSKGFKTEHYIDSFYSDLNIPAFPKYQKFLTDWAIGIEAMKTACINNKYNSYKKSFNFNDLDNDVFMNDNKLVVSDQNIGFYFDFTDIDNFTVYFLEKEKYNINKEMNRIKNSISNNTIDRLRDIVLEVQNGKITALNDALMYCFDLDMKFSVEAMKAEGVLNIIYPVDITSYAYQRDYYAHTYKMNEFEFIAQAAMTLGGGFDYDSKEGLFIDNHVKYIENLPTAKDSRNKKVKEFSYLLPKKISHLNPDWLEAISYATETLKTQRPKPTVFDGDDVEKALDKAIKHFEKVIKENKSSNKIKF